MLLPVNQLAVLAAVPHILTPRAPALADVAAHLQQSCCVEFRTQRLDSSNNVCHSLSLASRSRKVAWLTLTFRLA